MNTSLNGFSFDINEISGTCLVSFGYPTDEKHTHQYWDEYELDAEEAINKFNELYAKALDTYGYPSGQYLSDWGTTLEAWHSWVEADKDAEYICVSIEFPK